jgi:hypothetical protein
MSGVVTSINDQIYALDTKLFESLDLLVVNKDSLEKLKVVINSVSYDLLLKSKSNAKYILVFGQSALGNRSAFPIPIFHRWTWFEDYKDAHCICLNDPTLYLNENLLGGWFQGVSDDFYMKNAALLVQKIAELLGVKNNNIFFYGSSAGGFSSLFMAAYVKGSTAIADIPQTDMSKYHVQSALNGLLNCCYDGRSIEEVYRHYPDRFSVSEFYKKINFMPNIIYMQNSCDEIHLSQHMMPFISDTSEILMHSKTTFMAEFYAARNTSGDGHVAAGRGLVNILIHKAFLKFGSI